MQAICSQRPLKCAKTPANASVLTHQNEVESMGLLHQRHIIVAISGGIAAYKGAELVRLLKKQGAIV